MVLVQDADFPIAHQMVIEHTCDPVITVSGGSTAIDKERVQNGIDLSHPDHGTVLLTQNDILLS